MNTSTETRRRKRIDSAERAKLLLAFDPKFRSWRVNFHALATPMRGGHGPVSVPDFNGGAVAANHAHTRA